MNEEYEIKVCKFCGKVDCTKEHEDNCNYEYGNYKIQSDDNQWK